MLPLQENQKNSVICERQLNEYGGVGYEFVHIKVSLRYKLMQKIAIMELAITSLLFNGCPNFVNVVKAI
ncbi:hypothetical protein FQA39_LY10227 [Lamprigera yunnana]|nr:hypothetical protein FQA39_LY10227 [Lamprigera yunnana]